MLEIGTSGLMSGEEKRVTMAPRFSSTLPNWGSTGDRSPLLQNEANCRVGRDRPPFCGTKVRLKGADYQWVKVPLQELSV